MYGGLQFAYETFLAKQISRYNMYGELQFAYETYFGDMNVVLQKVLSVLHARCCFNAPDNITAGTGFLRRLAHK